MQVIAIDNLVDTDNLFQPQTICVYFLAKQLDEEKYLFGIVLPKNSWILAESHDLCWSFEISELLVYDESLTVYEN